MVPDLYHNPKDVQYNIIIRYHSHSQLGFLSLSLPNERLETLEETRSFGRTGLQQIRSLGRSRNVWSKRQAAMLSIRCVLSALRSPSAISHQPSAISHQPSAISHQPSAISHQQPSNVRLVDENSAYNIVRHIVDLRRTEIDRFQLDC
jgi:hypothetical protein